MRKDKKFLLLVYSAYVNKDTVQNFGLCRLPRHYKIFCVNVKYRIQNRVLYFFMIQSQKVCLIRIVFH